MPLPLPLGEGWGEGFASQHSQPLNLDPSLCDNSTLRNIHSMYLPLPVGEGWGEGRQANDRRE